MDFTDALKAGGASATIIAIVAIVYKVVSAVCGHRVRSECCGHIGTVGVITEEMSPRIVLDKPPQPAGTVVPSKKEDSLEKPLSESHVSAAGPAKDERPMTPLEL